MTLLGSEHSILIRSKFRSVLQLRLQQRRTREQLADQGIMPHSASAGSSLEAQMRLKRARLAEELSEKLALRPGPLELVRKNIIPLGSTVSMTVNHGKFPKQEDTFAFEEDSSSESLSPDQQHSDESQGSICPSSEAVANTASSSSSPALTSPRQGGATRDPPDQSQDEELSGANNSQTTPPIAVPSIVKSKTPDKNKNKKHKDVKPKVKKLKYHQYIPPDQKAEKSPPPMDSAYARLLQQQQLFLQLQILSQQKHAQTHSQTLQQSQLAMQTQAQQRQPAFSYLPHPSNNPQKGANEQLSACSSSGQSSSANSNSSSPAKNTFQNQSSISPVKPGPLPANLDDLKVSELRQHLRIRGMPVSGTKTALIERLRPFRDSNAGSSPSSSSDITTVTFPVTPTGSLSSYQSPSSSSILSHGGYYPYPSTSSSPPVSPASSELSLSGSLPDSFSDVPMSSPTQFTLQPSPGQLAMEDVLGGGGGGGGSLGGGGQSATEGRGLDGRDAEKDKMLVEKQKVIEELTWKLHQEQRQVEELRMQLHKRKRCYGASQDTTAPPSHFSMQTPAMMNQHFFGVTVKQEPVALSSSCPVSSPKQLKSPSRCCMEDIGHCNTSSMSNMGGGGPHCMDTGPSSSSPNAMSGFLNPQCSPQDSNIEKPARSSTPSSPNNPYLLSPLNRAHNMQMQQNTCGSPVSAPYPSDQRSFRGVFPSSAECGLNHSSSNKAEHPSMTPKMSVVASPQHVGLKCPPVVSSSGSDDLNQPPCYEDAVKQQLTRSQQMEQMDELLDVLIETGEMPANAGEERESSSVTKVVPHLTVSPGCPSLLIPRFHRHYEHPSSTQLPYDHVANHDGHLETLLGGSVKLSTEDMGPEDDGNREGDRYPHKHQRHPHHPLQEKILTSRDLVDTPLSPVGVKPTASVPEVQGMVSMAFSEMPWETMEWLDLTPPTSAPTFSMAAPSAPSIFNTEFLDVTDIALNSAMDLHLEHW